MKEKKSKKMPKGTKVTKEFLFKLTQAEFADKGQEAAARCKEAEKLSSQFEEVKTEWKAKITAVEAKRDELLAVIHAKEEKRTVDAILVQDFEGKRIQYWFEGRVIEERAMTEAELQMELKLKNSKKAEDKKADDAKGKKASVAERTEDGDVKAVIRAETRKASKVSSVDGARA